MLQSHCCVCHWESMGRWGGVGRCSRGRPGWRGEVWRRWSPSRSGGRLGIQPFRGLEGGLEGGEGGRGKKILQIISLQPSMEAFPISFWCTFSWPVTWEYQFPFSSLWSFFMQNWVFFCPLLESQMSLQMLGTGFWIYLVKIRWLSCLAFSILLIHATTIACDPFFSLPFAKNIWSVSQLFHD